MCPGNIGRKKQKMEGEKNSMNTTCLLAKEYNADVIIEPSELSEKVQIFRREKHPEETGRKLRVAAYCRVSTDKEEQERSLEIQMESFEELIEKNPDWELVEIYADPGKSGTSVKNRKEFLRMIEDARAGKIDYILAKSVSRFARNTLDTLNYTRQLHDMGVGVYFETENLNTGVDNSEILLTMFASFSQELAHDISEWIKNGLRKNAELGRVRYHACYGYTGKGKEKWVVVSEEAEIIRRIFDSYVKGKTIREIADELNDEGLVTRSGSKWLCSTIGNMLRNEKYVGDYLFQKSFIENFLTHKIVNNADMKLPQFYIKDNHEPIVSKEVFEEAREIMHLRKGGKGSLLYPYYGYLVCPHCETPLVSFVLDMQYTPKCWVCPGSNDGIKRMDRSDCVPFALHEKVLNEAVRKAIMGLDEMESVSRTELCSIQSSLRQNGRIERYYLKTLVKKITFHDWEHLVVFWKNGEKTIVPFEIKGYCSHPYPEVMKKTAEYVECGGQKIPIKRFEKAKKSIERREYLIQNIEVFMPDEKAHFQMPAVRKGS